MNHEYYWSPEESTTLELSPVAAKQDQVKERRQWSCLSLGIATIPILSIVAQVILSVVLAFLLADVYENLPAWFSIAAGSICMYGIAMPLSYLIFRLCKTQKPHPQKIGVGTTFAWIAVSMALTFAGSILGTLINLIISAITGSDLTNPVADMVQDVPMWAILLFVVVMAPVVEEIFFRKVLIDRLLHYGEPTAVLVSGLIFGLMHGNFSQFFYATLLGFVFGVIYCRTGKLRYTILLHMFINFFGSAYSTKMLQELGELPDVLDLSYITSHLTGFLMMGGYYLLYGIAFVACIPCAIYLFRRFRLKKPIDPISCEIKKAAIAKNPMVWILVAVLLANFILNSLPA